MNTLLGRKRCLFAALLLAAAPACLAQTVLVQYNLTGSNLAPSTVASGVTAANVTTGYSWYWIEATNGLQTNPSTTTNAVEAAAQGSGFYSYFTISSTTPMNLSSLTFNAGYGNFSSPAGYDFKTSVDGYASYLTDSVATALPALGANTVNLTAAQFQGLTSITFQVYGYATAYGFETFNDLAVNGSLGTPPLSAANTTISANPASIPANGTSTTTLTVQAKDASNHNMTSSGGVVTLSTTAGTLGSVTDNGNGTYTATLTSSATAGTANITGTIAGTAIGHPASVIFSGLLSAATTTISANPASIPADGISTSTITVQARDANGNNITMSSGTVTLSTTAGSLGSVTDNANGTYTAVLTAPMTAGSANLTGTIAGTAIGNPTSVTFTVPLSAANSTITANPTTIAADGASTSTITVQAKDVNNNNMTFGSATVTLATSLGTLSSITNNGNGTYTAVLTASTSTGTATITGTIASTAIGHPASVSFTSSLTPSELVQYNLESTTTPLAPSGVIAGVTAGSITFGGYAGVWTEPSSGVLQENAGATATTPAQAVTNPAGPYYAIFTLTSALPMNLTSLTFGGAYTPNSSPAGYALLTSVTGSSIFSTAVFATQAPTFSQQSIDLTGAQFQGLSSITFDLYGYCAPYAALQFENFTVNGTLGPPLSATNTTISANPASITANGSSTSTITVQARDPNGDNLTSSRGTVSLSTSAGSLGSVTDNANGTYTAILTSTTTVGTANITGTIAGAVIGNPTSVNFVPGPVSAVNTSISPNPASIPANGTSTSTLTVQARDAYNNNLTSSGGTVILNTTAGSLGSVTDNGNGTYTAILTSPATTGTANITGTIAGATIGQPASVIFTGPLSAANTTISANPTAITANGTSTSTIKVQAKDANGVNITVSSGTVTLSTTSGSLGSVTDNGNGTYTAILTSSTTAGTASLSGTIAGVAIGHPTSVTFTAPVSAANSTITANPTSIVANGTNTSTITVKAMDANNNVTLTAATVTLNTSGGSLSGITNNGDGTYTAMLTASTFPGTANITGTIAGGAIGHTVAVTFTPSPNTLVITNIVESAQTGARIAWNAFPGQSYSVLSSPNLATWTPTSVGVANQFTDPNGQTAPQVFYQVEENINPNPRISIGKPTAGYTAAAYQNTSGLDDGIFATYGTAWNGGYPTPAAPAWVAINLGPGPTRVLLEWNAGFNFNYQEENYGGPGNYAIYTSSNSTTGADGTWTLDVSVTNNPYRTRSHSFDFTGMSWVKMVITSAPSDSLNGASMDEIEVYDISEAYSRGRMAEDAWFFMGDSITAHWADRATASGTNDPASHQPSFAGWINIYNSNYFPSMINGGIGGEETGGALARLPQNLIDNPDYHYWALCYGANDSAGNGTDPSVFKANMQAMITMLLANGRIPVIPHIAYTLDGGHNGIPFFNAAIDQLVASNHILAGPDFYTYFQTNTNDFMADGLHPNDAGDKAYNLIWAQTMRYLYP